MRGSSGDSTLAMAKLDAQVRPGLTATEFYETFTRCACGSIMSRRAFRFHFCRYTIIDLTGDTSDDETPERTSGNNQGEVDLTLDKDESSVKIIGLT